MPTPLERMHQRAFTLVELLVAMAVLIILVGVTAQLTSGVSSIVNRGGGHLDADGQARALLDRMGVDIGAMVKRPDVDYYLKGRPLANDQKSGGGYNDQIAFYTEVPGYFGSAASTVPQSRVSVVAYRVNSTTLRMERLCKGVTWDGSGSTTAMGFLPVPLASPLPSPLPSPTPVSLPAPLWPQAADPQMPDLDYEEVGPQVFRFEYYYVLKGQTATGSPKPLPATLSLVPWYSAAPISHTSVNGMSDVAGIGVLIAVLDQKSRRLVSQNQLTTLVGQMEDAPDPTNGGTFKNSGDIEQQWATAVNSSSLPRSAASAVHIYSRCFYLNGVSP